MESLKWKIAILLVLTFRFTFIFLERKRKNEAWKEGRRKGRKKISESRRIDKRSKQCKKEGSKSNGIFTWRCYCKFPYVFVR
jgi:hypothetical protein